MMNLRMDIDPTDEAAIKKAIATLQALLRKPKTKKEQPQYLCVESCGFNKIHLIGKIRQLTGLGLKECRDVAEGNASIFCYGLNKKDNTVELTSLATYLLNGNVAKHGGDSFWAAWGNTSDAKIHVCSITSTIGKRLGIGDKPAIGVGRIKTPEETWVRAAPAPQPVRDVYPDEDERTDQGYDIRDPF